MFLLPAKFLCPAWAFCLHCSVSQMARSWPFWAMWIDASSFGIANNRAVTKADDCNTLMAQKFTRGNFRQQRRLRNQWFSSLQFASRYKVCTIAPLYIDFKQILIANRKILLASHRKNQCIHILNRAGVGSLCTALKKWATTLTQWTRVLSKKILVDIWVNRYQRAHLDIYCRNQSNENRVYLRTSHLNHVRWFAPDKPYTFGPVFFSIVDFFSKQQNKFDIARKT